MSSEESESEDELHQLNIPKYVELERPEPEFIPETQFVDTQRRRSKQKKTNNTIWHLHSLSIDESHGYGQEIRMSLRYTL